MPKKQPPKRRGAPASSSAAPKRARQSKLAKENNISAEEENEIKEVFQLFADSHEDFPNEKEGVIPREDVRKALVYVSPHLSFTDETRKHLLSVALYHAKFQLSWSMSNTPSIEP